MRRPPAAAAVRKVKLLIQAQLKEPDEAGSSALIAHANFIVSPLESFNLELQRINFRIKYLNGAEEHAMVATEQGFGISRRGAAMLMSHPVAKDLLPPSPGECASMPGEPLKK